jgi:hypothetical protein
MCSSVLNGYAILFNNMDRNGCAVRSYVYAYIDRNGHAILTWTEMDVQFGPIGPTYKYILFNNMDRNGRAVRSYYM